VQDKNRNWKRNKKNNHSKIKAMKTKSHFLCLIFLLVFAGLNHSLAATAHSKTYGGHWNVASTWEENFIPGPNDTAYIEGPVGIGTVVGYDISHSFGGWVIIEPQGHLYPIDYGGGLGIFILYVEHDIINNGLLTNEEGPDGDEWLKLIVKGNITNNNVWRPYQTDLAGTGDQLLSLAVGKCFGGSWVCSFPHPIITMTDMWFDCKYIVGLTQITGDFDLNGSILHMESHAIRATGTLIYDGIFEGDFEITGIFRVNKFVEDTLVFQGNVTITDTLESTEYGGGYGIQKLKIIGNIINNGVVRDREDVRNADDLNILITGNITNNGKWTCNFVNFIGTETQFLEQGPGKQFESNFYDLDASSAIVANSDISNTQNIDLNGSLLEMQGYRLTMAAWLTDGSVNNAVINGGYLQSLTVMEMLTLQGTVVVDNFVVFDCPVHVAGTLKSNAYGGGDYDYDLVVVNNIINNGVITNYDSGDRLRLHVNGNIENNGEWSNSVTYLAGSTDQTITLHPDKSFNCDLQSQKTNGNIVAISDLKIYGSINLQGSLLKMEGHRLTLGQWLYSGHLDNATVHGGILQGIIATTSLTIEGVVTVDDNNAFNCNVLVSDTLQCNTYGGGSKYYDLPITGNLSNYGVIRSFGSGMLRLFITGNLLNSGEWLNYLTYVYLVGDQIIELVDNASIDGSVQFEAEAGPGPYQWLFNDEILDSPDFNGENSQVLSWLVPVTDVWYGRFFCSNGSKTTAGITVRRWITGIAEAQTCNAGIWSNDHWLMIDLKEYTPADVMVYDLSGRMVAAYNINNGLTTITLDSPGIYLVKVQSGQKLASKKVVIR
jgi:hypothetical protein